MALRSTETVMFFFVAMSAAAGCAATAITIFDASDKNAMHTGSALRQPNVNLYPHPECTHARVVARSACMHTCRCMDQKP